jgi:hypothetical protein
MKTDDACSDVSPDAVLLDCDCWATLATDPADAQTSETVQLAGVRTQGNACRCSVTSRDPAALSLWMGARCYDP